MKETDRAKLRAVDIVLGAVLFLALVIVYYPKNLNAHYSAQSKRINNGKQILTACALFASDKGAGQYPKGRYSDQLKMITDDPPAASAEECFQDLFRNGILTREEFLFWSPLLQRQCSEKKPNEDGMLEAGENSWDFVAGMSNLDGSKPLLFDASDSGKGRKWTWKEGGHPWEGSIVIGYADGSSCRREKIDSNREVKRQLTIKGIKLDPDLCAPDPGKNGWPAEAVVAPATPFVSDWVGEGDPPFARYERDLVGFLPLLAFWGITVLLVSFIVSRIWKRLRRVKSWRVLVE